MGKLNVDVSSLQQLLVLLSREACMCQVLCVIIAIFALIADRSIGKSKQKIEEMRKEFPGDFCLCYQETV